ELFLPEVPAARALIDVAADASLVADLRRTDGARRLHQRGIKLAHLRMIREVRNLDRGPDLHAAIGRGDDSRVERVLDVDDAIGLVEMILQAGQQVLAAAERPCDSAAA